MGWHISICLFIYNSKDTSRWVSIIVLGGAEKVYIISSYSLISVLREESNNLKFLLVYAFSNYKVEQLS